MFESGKISKRMYTENRLLLKGACADVLPMDKVRKFKFQRKLDKFQKEKRPDVAMLSDPFDYV